MYSGGFYPYATLEEYWAYWSRYIWINRYTPAPKPVYENLLQLVQDKDYFVLTTNVDHCFQKAGFDKHRLFFIYAHIFLAAAHAMLDAREKALESLRAALDAALPDDVLMPFVENADLVLPLLLAPQETRHEDGVRRILALAEPWLRHLGLPGTRASEIPFGLSVKQYEIARLAAEGRTGPEIACRVGLGLNTVKTHLKTVYRKCGANNRPELRRLLHGEK